MSHHHSMVAHVQHCTDRDRKRDEDQAHLLDFLIFDDSLASHFDLIPPIRA